ncbi:MAG: hypothetical protein Q7T99_16450 [Pseudomonas sp.]|nr:hypothetical protein [Pseudomonas sp.]
METKHTPGPWLIQDSTVYALNERRPPVNRFHASVDSGYDNCDKRISREEVNANAKLIAAAPDLLEALEAFERIKDIWLPAEAEEQHAEEMYVLHMARNNMLAAIAKATA